MKNYTVFFEAFGKRMKMKVLAESIEHAKEKVKEYVKEQIVFHKTELTKGDEFNQIIDLIEVFTDGFKK